MRIYTVRHGQTNWNVEGKIQGRQGILPNVVGKMRAQALAKGMENRPITAVYSSPQLRAMEAAQTIVATQNVPIHTLSQLVEIDYRNWGGRRTEDILTTDRELYEP